MNIGQYLARTKEQSDMAKLRKVIAEYNQAQRELVELRTGINSQTATNK